MLKKNLIFIITLFIFGCSTVTTGPVDNDIDDTPIQTVDVPLKYSDSILEIKNIEKQIERYEPSLQSPITIHNKDQERYFSYIEAYDAKVQEQEDQAIELKKTGRLELIPGRSYSFLLESFCVHGKTPRPVKGDGLKIAEMKGPAKEYLPSMLEMYAKLNITQSNMQALIWSLLAGLKFDELSDIQQKNLKLFYPDAQIRFGNRQIENLGRDIFDSILPDEINNTFNNLWDLKQSVLSFQDNFKKLEEIMAPTELRDAIALGWTKSDDGYFIKASSENGYSKVKIEIYIPDDISKRAPQAENKIFFTPSKYIALPGKGQRLGLSSKLIKFKKNATAETCEKLKKWRPNQCKEISSLIRERILDLSDPKNFPNTRYASPPNPEKMIEEETDCSHFTHQIYHRAGINFPYVSTTTIACLKNFNEINQKKAMPGDLVLYPSHIAILNKNGKTISSTIGGTKRLSTLDRNDPEFTTSIKELDIHTFGNPKFFRWSCK